mgnify:CR=1 FL=1
MIIDYSSMSDLFSQEQIEGIRKYLFNMKWNKKLPGGFLTNYPQRLVNTLGNGKSIDSNGKLYGIGWKRSYWTCKQTQNNVSLETSTQRLPKAIRKLVPAIRNYVKKIHPSAELTDNSFSLAVCNYYSDPTMMIAGHTDDDFWYPREINGKPVFISLTFYPEGTPTNKKYYSRFQIKKDTIWEDVLLEDNSMFIMQSDIEHRVLKYKKKDESYFKPRINITLRSLYQLKTNPLLNYISVANHSRYYRQPVKLVYTKGIVSDDVINNILEQYNIFCRNNDYELVTLEESTEHSNKLKYINMYKSFIEKYNFDNVSFKANIVCEALMDVCYYINNKL